MCDRFLRKLITQNMMSSNASGHLCNRTHSLCPADLSYIRAHVIINCHMDHSILIGDHFANVYVNAELFSDL